MNGFSQKEMKMKIKDLIETLVDKSESTLTAQDLEDFAQECNDILVENDIILEHDLLSEYSDVNAKILVNYPAAVKELRKLI